MQERSARQQESWALTATRFAAFALAFGATAAHADFRYGVSVGGGHSDNITRVPENEIDQSMASAGLALLWEKETGRIVGEATADLSYVEYLDDAFDSEVVGELDGTVTVSIVPETFTWEFQDTFGQARADPFSPVTPDNRENVNYFTTGPNLTVNFGTQASMTLFGRYSATDYEDSTLDADRTSGGVALGRGFSQRSRAALNLVTEKVDFNQAAGGDYGRDAAFLSYNLDASRTDIVFDFGYTWLRPDEGEDDGAPYVDLTVTRNVTTSSTLILTASSQFSDTGDALRGSIEAGDAGTSITASADPFEAHEASLEWRFTRHRTTFALSFGWNESLYEDQTDFDSTRYLYTANYTRSLSPQLDLELHADYTDETFDNVAEESQDLSYGASLSWQLSRIVSLRLTLDHYTRDSTNVVGEFDENRIFLNVAFEPRGAVGLGGGT